MRLKIKPNSVRIRSLSCQFFVFPSTGFELTPTCLMSISRFSLRDKVTLQLLKLYFNITDVVEWSRALDIRLRDWCCSVSMVWVQIPSREENKKILAKDAWFYYSLSFWGDHSTYESNVFRYNKILIDCVFGNSKFLVPSTLLEILKICENFVKILKFWTLKFLFHLF
jgi:hypothetical protein